MLPSSGIQHRVICMLADVSESITSIFRVENQPSKKPGCSTWRWYVSPKRPFNIHNYLCEYLKSYTSITSMELKFPLPRSLSQPVECNLSLSHCNFIDPFVILQILLCQQGESYLLGFPTSRQCTNSSHPLCWPRDTLYPQKLALTSTASCGRSVGIVRSRTKATEFLPYLLVGLKYSLDSSVAQVVTFPHWNSIHVKCIQLKLHL
jgi:hypothetical protein